MARRYKEVSKRKAEGAHYTPTILADFVASQIVSVFSHGKTSRSIRVIDPSVGDGQLLLSLLRMLNARGLRRIEAFGFDTSEKAIRLATVRLRLAFPKVPVSLERENFLEFVLRHCQSDIQHDLFATSSRTRFDLFIANPPYVRTQVLGAARAQILARQFGLSGRVDLYHAFMLGIARGLRPGGIVGIIVSNRFMTTKSGAAVREGIRKNFDVLHVWDLGDTKIFGAAVLPAVLLLRKKGQEAWPVEPSFSSIYSANPGRTSVRCSNVIAALAEEGLVELENGQAFHVEHGRLDHGRSPNGVWRIATEKSNQWLEKVAAHTWKTFGEIGKVRVGVKTTADEVFIRSDWDQMPTSERPELLRTVTTHHVARRFKPLQPEENRLILYTHHMVQGERLAVDLKNFPRTGRYLNKHRSVLEARKYLIESGRNWYEIWVPQHPDAWIQPKIVFRDIVEKPTFWMDLDGSVVNGDCYWLACRKPEQSDLLWLALAVGNSTFVEAFYDFTFRNKLYAGRRRFMTQYTEQFPLPDPDSATGVAIIKVAKDVYALTPSPEAEALEEKLNGMVWQAFGLADKKGSW